MAKVTEVRLVDDLNGEAADETVYFGLDGNEYAIDLSADHAKALRENLADYVEKARKSSTSAAPRRQRRARQGESGVSPTVLREWARENGHSVSDRGRVSQAVRDAYAAAQSA